MITFLKKKTIFIYNYYKQKIIFQNVMVLPLGSILLFVWDKLNIISK